MRRQHLFIEDVSAEERLPWSMWDEAHDLGMRESQMCYAEKTQADKKTLRYLRFLRECENVLRQRHFYSPEETCKRVGLAEHSAWPPFLGGARCVGYYGNDSDAGRRSANRVNWRGASRLLSGCREAYGRMQWPESRHVQRALAADES